MRRLIVTMSHARIHAIACNIIITSETALYHHRCFCELPYAKENIINDDDNDDDDVMNINN